MPFDGHDIISEDNRGDESEDMPERGFQGRLLLDTCSISRSTTGQGAIASSIELASIRFDHVTQVDANLILVLCKGRIARSLSS